MTLDIDFVQQQFAGLDPEWSFLDNAGGSFVLKSVVARVQDYLSTCPVQTGASYPLSQLAASRQQAAQASLAEWIGAKNPSEIVLGPSATAMIWRVALTMASSLKAGDEIIITQIDHEANRSPWLRLAAQGVVIHQWQADQTGQLDLAQLDTLLNNRTRLVCFSACSNVLGLAEPIAEITRKVHAAGAKVLVDVVAYAPHRRLEVAKWNVDFCVLSLYKTFGPHLGLLYGRRDALLSLDSLNHEYLPADALPYRLQPGGANYELGWGAGAIPDYFRTLDQQLGGNGDTARAWQAVEAHENSLAGRLLEYLQGKSDIELLVPEAEAGRRMPIISFRWRGKSSQRVASFLDGKNIAARFGHFHARRYLEARGIEPNDGVIRVSFAQYNTRGDVERLITALEQVNTGA